MNLKEISFLKTGLKKIPTLDLLTVDESNKLRSIEANYEAKIAATRCASRGDNNTSSSISLRATKLAPGAGGKTIGAGAGAWAGAGAGAEAGAGIEVWLAGGPLVSGDGCWGTEVEGRANVTCGVGCEGLGPPAMEAIEGARVAAAMEAIEGAVVGRVAAAMRRRKSSGARNVPCTVAAASCHQG